MSGLRDGKLRINDAEVVPHALSSVPAGGDGQIAPVTDQPGVHLMVREGGVLKPAVEPGDGFVARTLSNIVITMDPVAGTSPPAGTTIHSQAEFDALGYSLKYPQDVLEILPTYIDHAILVQCPAGTYLARPNISGRPGYDYFLVPKEFRTSSALKFWSYDPAIVALLLNAQLAGIFFNGTSWSDHSSGLTGSRLSTHIVSVPGSSWTTDEHVGRYARITSGANAGSKYVIVSNTVDTFEVTMNIGSAGSMTFNISSPGAVFLSSLDGVSPITSPSGYTGLQDISRIGPHYIGYSFFNIQFGSPAIKWSGCNFTGGSYSFNYSRIYPNTSYTAFNLYGIGAFEPGYLAANYCVFDCQSAAGAIDMGSDGAVLFASGTLFTGTAGSFLRIDNNVGYYLGYCVFRPGVGMYYPVRLGVGGSGYLWAPVRIKGNGICTGILIYGIYTNFGGTINAMNFQIDNCAEGLRLQSGALMQMGAGITGSGNAIGYKLETGSELVIVNPTALGATTEIMIDGQAVPYADVAIVGTELVGAAGSRFVRR